MKVILKNVRLAFAQSLFVAEQYQGAGAFRHSCKFIIEPGSDNDTAIRNAISQAAEAVWAKKAPAMLKTMEHNSNKFCYVEGNPSYDGFEGKMALTSHRKGTDGAPMILSKDKTALSESSSGKPYGGCFVNASVEIYAQDGTTSGIRCGLIAVQMFADGDSFGGASKGSTDDFEDVSTANDDLA